MSVQVLTLPLPARDSPVHVSEARPTLFGSLRSDETPPPTGEMFRLSLLCHLTTLFWNGSNAGRHPWGQNTQSTCNLPENQEFTRASWMNLGRHACRDGVAGPEAGGARTPPTPGGGDRWSGSPSLPEVPGDTKYRARLNSSAVSPAKRVRSSLPDQRIEPGTLSRPSHPLG